MERSVETETRILSQEKSSLWKTSIDCLVDLLLLLGFWISSALLMMLGWMLMQKLGVFVDTVNTQNTLEILLITMLSMYAAVLALWLWRGRHIQLPAISTGTQKLILQSLGVGLLLFVGNVCFAYLSSKIGFQQKPENQKLVENLFHEWPIIMSVFICLAAPVFEEMLFRQQIYGRFTAAGFAKIGLLLSSLLFALMHAPKPEGGYGAWLFALTLYGGLGVGMALWFRKTGKIWAAMLAHAVNNIIGVLVLLFAADLAI